MPLGKEVGLSLRQIVLDGDPVGNEPPQQLPHFRPLLIVAKRSPISATAERLLTVIAKLGGLGTEAPNGIHGRGRKSRRNKGASPQYLEWRMLMQIVHTFNE